MANRRKIFADVHFEKPAISTLVRVGLSDSSMGALAHTTGVGMVDLEFFQDGLHDIHEGMMHNPITKGSSRNEAFFGFVNVELAVFGMVPELGLELPL